MHEQSNYTAPRWAWWIATGFGSGKLKSAPGTWGSLAAGAVWFGLVFLIHFTARAAFEYVLGLLTLLMIFVSVFAVNHVVRQIDAKDPGYIVSDEWAGMWLALWPTRRLVAEAINGGSWKYALGVMFAAFLFFRFFDIWKPWPVRKLESLPRGWGVTLDDVMAGIFAGLVIYCAMVLI